jgi:hypothetical protein
MGLVGVAGLALVVGALFQGERLPEDQTPTVVGATEGGDTGSPTPPTDATTPISPIEGFLPRSGEASACREPVGVDLIDGYGATLTINGVVIPPEQMNVKLDSDGEITDEVTASRSLSQYTFGPEESCPNGEILRATNNVVQACVYRLEDGPGSCVITEFTFDVL